MRSKPIEALDQFLYEPASPRPLAVLRIALALTLLTQAGFLFSVFFDLYGPSGILQEGTSPEPASAFGLALWLKGFEWIGVSAFAALGTLGVLYVASLCALLVGLGTRVAAVMTWATHLVLMHGQTTIYGLDLFAHVALFLLCWMPCGLDLSLDARAAPQINRPTPAARLSIRVFQIYLSIAYFASGMEKALGDQWWNGEAIWRSLMLPSIGQFDFSWAARYPKILVALGWQTLIVEIGYAFFIWPRRTRRLWLVLTVLLHAGIAVFMGLWLFGLIMIVLNVAIFGVSAEPRRTIGRKPDKIGASLAPLLPHDTKNENSAELGDFGHHRGVAWLTAPPSGRSDFTYP